MLSLLSALTSITSCYCHTSFSTKAASRRLTRASYARLAVSRSAALRRQVATRSDSVCNRQDLTHFLLARADSSFKNGLLHYAIADATIATRLGVAPETAHASLAQFYRETGSYIASLRHANIALDTLKKSNSANGKDEESMYRLTQDVRCDVEKQQQVRSRANVALQKLSLPYDPQDSIFEDITPFDYLYARNIELSLRYSFDEALLVDASVVQQRPDTDRQFEDLSDLELNNELYRRSRVSKLEIRSIEGMGRGVIAKDDLAAGETLAYDFALWTTNAQYVDPKLFDGLAPYLKYLFSNAVSPGYLLWLHAMEGYRVRTMAQAEERRFAQSFLSRLHLKMPTSELPPASEEIDPTRINVAEALSHYVSICTYCEQLLMDTENFSFYNYLYDVVSCAPNVFSFGNTRNDFGIRAKPALLGFITCVNHSCGDANAEASIDEHGHAALRSTRKIKKGEQIFISYMNPDAPYEYRQKQLHTTYGFDCRCSTCIAHR